MVGIPASGKSTIAQKLVREENAVWLSSDKIREELYGDESIQGNGNEVFSLMEDRVRENLEAGNTVVYDATCVFAKIRTDLLERLNGTYDKAYCHYFDVPLEEAIKRNSQRDRKVPEKVIQRMYNNLQCPTEQEGFDRIYIY